MSSLKKYSNGAACIFQTMENHNLKVVHLLKTIASVGSCEISSNTFAAENEPRKPKRLQYFAALSGTYSKKFLA